MADRTVKVILTAEDRMSPAMRSAGREAEVLHKKLDSTSKGLGGVGSAAISAGKSMAAGFAGAAVAGGLKATVDAASDLNETLNKSGAIFGNQAAAMSKWGDTAANSLGMSKQAAIDAAASFGDMFLQIGFAGEQAAQMSKQVVQMSADFGSFNNLPTADVSERISAAFRGEYDSLQALIPNINAARVEQEAMAESGVKQASALTAQQKAQAVLTILQKDGARAQGDFAKTSDEAANAQKRAEAQAADLAAQLGQNLLPVWKSALGVANNTILPALATMASGAASAVSAISNLPGPIQAVGAALLTWKLAGPAISSLTSAVGTKAASGFQSLATAVSFAGQASERAGGGFRGAAAGMKTFTGGAGLMKSAAGGLVGLLGGPWGAAFAGAALAVTAVGSAMAESKARTESMTQAITSSGDAMSKASREAVAMSLAQSGLLKNLTESGVAAKDAVDAVMGLPGAYDRVNSSLNTNIIAHHDLMSALRGQQGQFNEAKAAADQYKAGQDAAASSTQSTGAAAAGAAAPQKGLGDAFAYAELRAKAFDTVLKGLRGSLDSEAAADAFTTSIQALGKELDSSSHSLTGHSAAALKNREAMRARVEAGLRVIETMKEEGAGQVAIRKKSQELAAQIDVEAKKHGMNAGEVKKYSDQLRKVPAKINTEINVNTRQALAAIQGVITAMNRIPGLNVPGLGAMSAMVGAANYVSRNAGGPIVGPGTATSDSILMRGSNGEHVLTAEEVERLGGHGAVYALRDAVMGRRVLRRAEGGPVGYAAGGAVSGLPTLAQILTGRLVVELDVPESVKNVRTGFDKLREALRSSAKDLSEALTGVASAEAGLGLAYSDVLAKSASAAGSGSTPGAYRMKGALAAAPANLRAMFISYGAKYGVDPNLLAAIAKQESNFNVNAVSPAGARGLMQFMPATARQYKVNTSSAASSIEGAAHMMRNLLAQFGQQTNLALAAYNAGPGNVTNGRWRNFSETRNYVAKIMADPGLAKTAAVTAVKATAAVTSKPAMSKQDTLIAFGAELKRLGIRVTENRALGDSPGKGHAKGGYHYRNNNSGAIDVTGSTATMDAVAKVANQLGLRTIWKSMVGGNHYNHVHVDYGSGSIGSKGKGSLKGFDYSKFKGKAGKAGTTTTSTSLGDVSIDKAVSAAEEAAKKLAEVRAKIGKSLSELGITLTDNELARLTAAGLESVAKILDKSQPKMERLAAAWNTAAEAAKKALDDYQALVKEADAYAESVASKYVSGGALGGLFKVQDGMVTSIQSVMDERRKMIESVKTFAKDIAELKALGLNDTDLRAVVDMGPEAGGAFLKELKAAGPAFLSEWNATQAELVSSTDQLGAASREALYQTGIDASKALSDGLTADAQTRLTEFEAYGKQLADSVRRGLGLTVGVPATTGSASPSLTTPTPVVNVATSVTIDGKALASTVRTEVVNTLKTLQKAVKK